ncbi:Ca2+-binding protein, putative [Bodo saltans]|uniref:Ca2+-binding protein, putative n=1 Tax=Bodo saltans TaxID=75058 RepID=A0A0S4JII0_BODSA|nr:Ca2+-binding protein, putative [Bodo saltans]|eukprot:CUG88213.1 Ca2+-binding protein, putative [Bodo saltans]
MQFTPQQMAGYKGYSSGVLVGNWSEDLQVMEDKMTLYEMTKAGVSSNANSTFAVKAAMTEPAQIGPAAAGNTIPFNVPLQIRSDTTEGILALDVSPRYAPRLNHVNVTFAPKGSQPQVRNVWVLQRVPDPNADFYASVGEEGILHYGQKVKIVNENSSNNGFYSLISTLQDTAKSSSRLELAACLGGGNGTVFVVEPAGALPGTKDGKPVLVTDAVVIIHGATNSPLACEAHHRTSNSFGGEFEAFFFLPGTKDGKPVLVTDAVVIIHGATNSPLACEAHHRTSNSFGGEFEASCGIIKSQATRAQSKVCTQEGNYFHVVMQPVGSKWTPVAPRAVPSALQRVKAKILERGGRNGFRGLVRFLGQLDENGDKSLSRAEFRNAMETFGIPMGSSELDAVFNTFDRNGDGKVTIAEFVRTMRGEMNSRRVAIVQEAFTRLNRDGRGDVELHDLIDVFSTNASLHPDAGKGASHEELIREFLDAWGGSNGRISRAQFVEYYSDISAGIDKDDYFELLVRNAWHISGGEGWCENTTARRVLVVFNDDTQRVVELTDDLGLRGDDTQGILKKLASQGITSIKRIQLTA